MIDGIAPVSALTLPRAFEEASWRMWMMCRRVVDAIQRGQGEEMTPARGVVVAMDGSRNSDGLEIGSRLWVQRGGSRGNQFSRVEVEKCGRRCSAKRQRQ